MASASQNENAQRFAAVDDGDLAQPDDSNESIKYMKVEDALSLTSIRELPPSMKPGPFSSLDQVQQYINTDYGIKSEHLLKVKKYGTRLLKAGTTVRREGEKVCVGVSVGVSVSGVLLISFYVRRIYRN
jgi:hypothetical protein